MTATVQFSVERPRERLADLRERLRRTSWPDSMPDAGWDYGTSVEYVRQLCRYWEKDFDWRHVEQRFNCLAQ